MSLEVGVLTFFLFMVFIGIMLIITGEDNTGNKPGYRLKICTTHLNLVKLRYSNNYGLTWKSVPLGITGKYEPRFYYCVKLDDEDKVRLLTILFEKYLNDYQELKYQNYKLKGELADLIQDYRDKQITKLTKTSIT